MPWHVSTRRTFWSMLFLGWFMPVSVWAIWAEPSCDPSDDPTLCTISAPLNVSSTDQSKTGGLTLGGALTANSTLTVSGTTTLSTLVVNGTSSTFNSLAIFNKGIDVADSFDYTGSAGNFNVTADSIVDADVSNTLTASNFVGTGSTSNSVDLATAEVSGTLPSTSVTDVWVNTSGDTMTGTLTLGPTSAVDALSITPNSTQEAIYITGATGQPLVSLNPSGGSSGAALSANMSSGSGDGVVVTSSSTHSGRGIYVNSSTANYPMYVRNSGSGYSLFVDSTGSSTRGVNVEVDATGGYGVYAVASSTTSGVGVFGSGVGYGVWGSSSGRGIFGTSDTGYGGYFSSATTSGTGLYSALTSSSTTTTSKALEVIGKNGYGGYFTTDGSTSTALYAENTAATYGSTNYAIYAKTAPLPSSISIRAEADYGTAGYFSASNGGTAITATTDSGNGVYIAVTDGAASGLTISAGGGPGIAVSDNSGTDETSSGIEVSNYQTALEANTGSIHADAGFRGGQFFANDYAAATAFANNEPNEWNSTSIGSTYHPTDVLYDGNELIIGTNHNTATGIIKLVDSTTGQSLVNIDHGMVTDPVKLVVRDDYVYALNTTSNDYFRYDRLTGSTTTGTTGATVYPNAVVYDGETTWIGTDSTIQTWSFGSTVSTRASGLNSITDIIIADDYVYASSGTGGEIYKVERGSPYTVTTISTGYTPGDLAYDGQYIWTTSGDVYIMRINPDDESVVTYDADYYGENPNSLVFDGVNLWIGYENNVGPWLIAEERLGSEAESLSYSGTDPGVDFLAFDGTYVWAVIDASGGSTAYQIPAGAGYGTGVPLVQSGILLYNTSGTVVCLSVSGTTVSASTTLTNCQ